MLSLKVILVCGKSKTGKSDFCNSMSAIGYPFFSAGGIVRELYILRHRMSPTPIQLIEYGQQALTPDSELGIKLRNILLKTIVDANQPVIIDGLRVPWIFSEIMKLYVEKAHFILFESSDQTRIKRISEFYKGELDDQLTSALQALDNNVELFEKLATPIYKGNGGTEAFTFFGSHKYKSVM